MQVTKKKRPLVKNRRQDTHQIRHQNRRQDKDQLTLLYFVIADHALLSSSIKFQPIGFAVFSELWASLSVSSSLWSKPWSFYDHAGQCRQC